MTLYNASVTITWDNQMSVQIRVPPLLHTGGLCGNNDRDVTNELLPRYPVPGLDPLSQFLVSWRISSSHVTSSPSHVTSHDVAECQEMVGRCRREVLVRVCAAERGMGIERGGCGTECYINTLTRTLCPED